MSTVTLRFSAHYSRHGGEERRTRENYGRTTIAQHKGFFPRPKERMEIYAVKVLPVHRNFIILNQVIIATVFNFIINLVIAWFLYRRVDHIPLLGLGGIAFDTIVTAFMLTLLSYYFIALSVWFTMKMKWLPVIADYPTGGIVSKMIRTPIPLQGIIFGVLASALIALPVIAWFMLTRTVSMPYESFRWYKSIFGAVLSIIVSPPIGLLSLLYFSRRKKLIQ